MPGGVFHLAGGNGMSLPHQLDEFAQQLGGPLDLRVGTPNAHVLTARPNLGTDLAFDHAEVLVVGAGQRDSFFLAGQDQFGLGDFVH